jgi:two-component system, NtrC family, nitrogen regulation sensor histidine kinase NtrY
MKWQLPIFLLCASLILSVWFFGDWSNSNRSIVEQRIESRFNEILEEQRIDLADFKDQFALYSNPFDIFSDEQFYKRVFVNGSLVYWSDNLAIADYKDLQNQDSLFVLIKENNLFVVRRDQFSNTNTLVEIFSFIPLFTTPPISNEYLSPSQNERIFGGNTVRLKKTSGGLSISDLSLPIEINIQRSEIQDLLFFLSLLIIVAFLSWKALTWAQSRTGVQRVILVVAILFSARIFIWVMTTFVFEITFFDPIHFTSKIGHSIGDVVLHSLLGLMLIGEILRMKMIKIPIGRSVFVVSIILLMLNLALMSLSELVWDVMSNSQVSLDISSAINFDVFRILFLFLTVIWSAIYFILLVIFLRVLDRSEVQKWYIFIIHILFAGLAMLILRKSGDWAIIIGGTTFWIIALLRLNFQFEKFDYKAFLMLSIVIASLALIYALVIFKHYERDDLISKKKFANRLLIKNDFLGEYYLDQKLEEIKNDAFVRTRFSNQLLAQKNVKEKIKRQYLSSYFDKYDVEVTLFNADSLSMNNEGIHYSEMLLQYAQPRFATDYDQIFFVTDKEDQVQDRYYCFIPISSFNINVGFIALKMVLKKYIPRSVFPQLMIESKYYQSDDDRYDFAVYKEGKMLFKRGRFEFQNLLSYPDLVNPELFEQGIEKEGTHFFGLKTTEDKIYVIISPSFSIWAIVSNFSFYFLIIIFSFGILFFIISYVNRGVSFNLSTKIQLFLGLSFLVPMFIVSVALLNALNQSYGEEIETSFGQKAYNISENLTEAYERFLNNEINRDELGNLVAEVSSLIQSDINLYGTNGQLLVSSEMQIFSLGLLGKQISPDAYNAIKYGNAESKVYKQTLGDLVFSVAYVGLRSYKDGRLLGIMSMPYFDSKNHLLRQQIEVFNNLISIFTIIFLVSIVIGNLMIERLVRPLKLITERLKITNLNEVNAPMKYESDDEIGALIREYNLMIEKLEASKAALAESQKESAWKEIARQVAHEIKNPLTPMRLKIQQMMRLKDRENPDYNTLNSLIAQIDALSSIADSFSAFARMPAPKNERFDLGEILNAVVTVHCSGEADVEINGMQNGLWVYADPTIFSGIFNNIILNAVQAVEGKRPIISIEIVLKSKKVTLSFKDNGRGIAEEDRQRIFTPYFSTKITGSGIGLAVAKKGIENAGGNIWFESKEGEGTTFFISMPLSN